MKIINMSFCNRCGTQLNGEWVCPMCGTPVNDAVNQNMTQGTVLVDDGLFFTFSEGS